MNKKIIAMIFVFLLSFTAVFSEQAVTVKINEKTIEFDEKPQLICGRTMVPMRKIYEELGAKVEWIGEAQLIISTYKSSIITMKIGEKKMSITDIITGESKEIELDVPPQLSGSRTLVPARAVSEALGKNVDWNETEWTVLITDI